MRASWRASSRDDRHGVQRRVQTLNPLARQSDELDRGDSLLADGGGQLGQHHRRSGVSARIIGPDA
jgi:hypothetical protein